jgi:16S rRNA (adenine1518-N6/adenine1519-N6)-dimethyltransferase
VASEPELPSRDRAGRARRPRLRRALAQHHLRDPRSARPLVEWLRAAGRTVLEIGPGGGALTGELAAAGAARVIAVELDAAWAFALAARRREREITTAGSTTAVDLVVADALELAWERLPADWIVAGNLPYNVGTVLLERLLAAAPAGVRAGFLLQREVVDRMVAAPGSGDYGALSVRVAARARATRLGTLRPGAFVPPPKVDSAFVGLELVAAPLDAGGMIALDRVVAAAFGQRRKTLRNALGAGLGIGAGRAAALLESVDLDPGARAERLSLADFVALARRLGPDH